MAAKFWVVVTSRDHALDGATAGEKWGYIFRTGRFEINKHDFDLIESHMHK